MQSASRKLMRTSSGQQSSGKRHNNRKRTRGRKITYVPRYKEPSDEALKERVSDITKLNKFLESVIEHKALKKLVWKALDKTDAAVVKAKEQIKVLGRKLKRKRPTVESCVYMIQQEFREKFVFRTAPLTHGMVPGFG